MINLRIVFNVIIFFGKKRGNKSIYRKVEVEIYYEYIKLKYNSEG